MMGSPQAIAAWCWEQDPDAVIEAKVKRKHRSLTQNAYYWALLNQLASKLRMSDGEVHRQMLRDYGSATVFTVRADVPLDGYFRYWDDLGLGWLNGKEYRHVRALKGSSEMDSAEFSRLLDGMVRECEEQGIPTLSDEQVAGLPFAGGAS